MDIHFEKRIQQAIKGKEIFSRMFDLSKLTMDDTFLLVLTDNKDCICYGIKYLPDFIEFYHKRNVNVLLDNVQYEELFSQVGGNVRICSVEELQSLAVYLDMFYTKNSLDTRMIFLLDKDEYGFTVEELLNMKEFTLEEYVAISLYQLDGLKGEI